MQSLGYASGRDRESGRASMTAEKDFAARKSSDTATGTGSGTGSANANATEQPNGAPLGPRGLGGKPTVNGTHHRPSLDEMIAPDSTSNVSPSHLSTSLPEEPSLLSPDPDHLSPRSKGNGHRYSSPPTPVGLDGGNVPDMGGSSFRHRHSLQVPRATSIRRNSREQPDDAYSGRLSPTGGMHRPSFSLRRGTRSMQSDPYLEEFSMEDTSRWTEAVRQKRASKRRRHDDDDERVIVGKKVDETHVNWVTAYNMLTGIRFTVSRINAKMDRELTAADFAAQHKFSFDM